MSLPADLRADLQRWARTSGCRLLVVFGSAATGRARQRSDLDLALWFDPVPDAGSRLRLLGRLEDACGGRTVDAVFLRPETDPVLRFEIFRDGAPVYEREPGLFVRERVRAVMLHEDARPFRRALAERMGAGG